MSKYVYMCVCLRLLVTISIQFRTNTLLLYLTHSLLPFCRPTRPAILYLYFPHLSIDRLCLGRSLDRFVSGFHLVICPSYPPDLRTYLAHFSLTIFRKSYYYSCSAILFLHLHIIRSCIIHYHLSSVKL